MTLITIVILPLSVTFVALIVKKSQKYFIAQQEYLGKINGQIEETFSGHNIVKAFNREETELDIFHKTNGVLELATSFGKCSCYHTPVDVSINTPEFKRFMENAKDNR